MPRANSVNEHVVSVAGVDVRARQSGSGPTVAVLEHSIADGSWNALYDDLAADHTVVVIDLPGFNGSDRPEWARDVRDLAILVGGFLRNVARGPVTLVGSEFGGWVAAELAVMAPTSIANLVLVGPGGILPSDGAITDMMLLSHSEYARRCFSQPEAYEKAFSDGLTDDLLLTWDRNREMVARVAWKPYMYNRRLVPMLSEVTATTTVVTGSHDEIFPRVCADEFVRGIPDAELCTVDGCGNAVAYERSEHLAAVVRARTT